VSEINKFQSQAGVRNLGKIDFKNIRTPIWSACFSPCLPLVWMFDDHPVYRCPSYRTCYAMHIHQACHTCELCPCSHAQYEL